MPEEGQNFIENDFGASIWLKFDFELIEDNNIDIDSIKSLLEIEPYEADKVDTVINRNTINELIQAVKQLDREIKELKEKTNAK